MSAVSRSAVGLRAAIRFAAVLAIALAVAPAALAKPPTPPGVDRLIPNHGPAAGGYQVTIAGSNLNGATAVKFDTVRASGLRVLNDSTITVNAPAGSAGSTAEVTVVTPHGTSKKGGTANDFSYDPVLPPTVTGLYPAFGPPAGGNQVTITGSGFAGAAAVSFGAAPAAFQVLNNATITATAPPGSGVVDIFVTTPRGFNPGTGVANDYSYDPLLSSQPRTPNTFITHHPYHHFHKRKAAFGFRSNISGVSFKCLYADGWAKCHSPHVFRHLKPGRYRFRVKAVAHGVADPTPASFTFRVRH